MKIGIIAAGLLGSCVSDTKNSSSSRVQSPSTSHKSSSTEGNHRSIVHKNTQDIVEIMNPEDVVHINIKKCKTSSDQADQALLEHIKPRYRSLEIMLGSTDAKNIIAKYNPHLAQKKHPEGISIEHIDSLIIPRISPSLQGFFLPSLADFLAQHDTLRDLIGNNQHAVITTKNGSGMFCCGVYVNGILQYAYATSPGQTGEDHDTHGTKFHKFTPMGSYIATRMEVKHESKADDKMAFYFGFYDPRGLGIHGSQRVDGLINRDKIGESQKFRENGQSHGCIRGVHVYRYLTYKALKAIYEAYSRGEGEPIVFANYRTPSKNEQKDAQRYLEKRGNLDSARKNASFIKPVLSAQHRSETHGIDTVSFKNFAYLYGLDATGKSLFDTLTALEEPKVQLIGH